MKWNEIVRVMKFVKVRELFHKVKFAVHVRNNYAWCHDILLPFLFVFIHRVSEKSRPVSAITSAKMEQFSQFFHC